MRVSELSRELGVPLKWIEARGTKRNAHALITVTNESGEKSILISQYGMMRVDSKNYVDAPKERAAVQKRTFSKVLALTTKTMGWALVALLLTFTGLTSTGILQARVVLTDSMTPQIKPGDVIISVAPDRMPPKIGDVVTYTGKRFDGTTVASFSHRIIAGDAGNGFTVKGDHNETPDVQKPTIADIQGVLLFTIPLLGKLLNPQVFTLILLSGFGLWLIVDAFRNEE
jgi:signal peptidase I